MRSTLFSFIIIGLLLFSCKESSDPNIINVSSEDAFHSSELSEAVGAYSGSPQAVFDFGDQMYKHYLVIYRGKDIARSDDFFGKTVRGETSITDIELSLRVNQTEMVSKGVDNFVTYNFSNNIETILVDGVATDKLPQNLFNELPFEFIVGETTYQGNFPEPGSIKDNNTTPNISFLDIKEVKTINWKPAEKSGSKIKIYINHHSTVNGTTRLPIKVLTVDDTGSFDITPEILSDYLEEDMIGLSLERDIFLASDELLIRSVEVQNWGPIELLDR